MSGGRAARATSGKDARGDPTATTAMRAMRIGLVDTGVNAWHSHVRGAVEGCRLSVAADGRIVEDGDFRDLIGHGTAVAGVLREGFPSARLFVVRVFDQEHATYASLVARAILRAVAEDCAYVNLSIAVPPGPGTEAIRAACNAALGAGCVLVASVEPGRASWLPACLPGVLAASADDRLAPGIVLRTRDDRFTASGAPRDLEGLPRGANLWGHSFACARTLVHLATSAAVAR